MKLYLLQHGEACAKEQDPERPLTRQGETDIDRLGLFLDRAGIKVERVIHSGKLRAVQSAERLANVIAPGVVAETGKGLKPNDDPQTFSWIGKQQSGDTLVVGHLPFMAKLVAYLVVGAEGRMFTAFKPGSLVCLEQGSDAHWHIVWMLRPELFTQR